MPSDLPAIILNLKHGLNLEYRLLNTGEKGSSIITNGKVHLNRGKIYYLPITNGNLDLDASHVIKPKGSVNEILDIRNVENGYVTVQPIINNILLRDGDELGWLL